MADPPIIQLPADAQHQQAVAAPTGLLASSASFVQLVQHDASRDVWQAYGLVGGQLTLLGIYAEQFDALAAAQQHQLQQQSAEHSGGMHVPAATGLAGTSVSTPPTQQLQAQQLQVQLQQQQQQLHVPAAQPAASALQQQTPAQHGPAMQQQAVAAAAAALAAANAAVAATGGRVQPGSAASTSTTGQGVAGQAAPAHSSYADVPGLQAELNCAAEIVAVAAEAKHRQQQAMANQSALLSAQGGVSITQQQLQQLQQPSGLMPAGSIPAAGAGPAAAHAAGVQSALGGLPRQGMGTSHSCLDFSAMASLGSAAEPLGPSVPTLRSRSSFDAQQMQAVQQLQQQHSMRLQAQAEQQQVLLQVPAQAQQQVAQHLQPQPQLAMPHLPAQLQAQTGEVVQQGMQLDLAHPTASQMLVQQMQAQAQAQQHQQQQLMFQQQMQQQQAAMQTVSAGGGAAGAASGSAGAAVGAAATTSAFTVTTELPVVSSRAAVNPATSAGYPAFTGGMGPGAGRVPATSSTALTSAFAGIATMPSVGPPAATVAAHTAGVVVGMPAVASAHSASLVARGSLTGLPVVQVAPGSASLSGTTAMGATPGLASSGSIGPPVAARSGGSHMGSGQVAATASTGAGGLPESKFKGVQWSVSERRWQAFWLNRAANEVVCLEAYDSEQDAAVAHDRAVLAALGPAASAADLNFAAHATHLSTQPGTATTSAAAAGGAAGGSVVTGSPWASAAAAAAAGTPTSVTTVTQPTPQAQQQQQGMVSQPLSYKGVVWDPVNLKYQAQALDSTGSVLLLGLYSTAEEAAVEYDTRLIMSGTRDESKLNFSLTRYLHLLCGTSTGVAQPAASGLSAQGSMGAHAAALAAAGDIAAMQAAATDMGAMQAAAADMAAIQAAAADMAAMQAAATDMAAMQAAAADMAAIAAGAGAMGMGLEAGAADTEAAVDGGSAGTGTASKGKGKKGKGVQKGGKAKSTRRGNPQSQYKGVSWSASTQRWAAVIWDRVHKKARHLGVYSNEEEAARVYDRQVLITQGLSNKGLNFQDSVDLYRDLIKPDTPPEGEAQQQQQQQLDAAAAAATPDTGGAAGADTGRAGTTVGKSSSYTGVSWHDRIGRWEVRCWFQGKQHFAGSFETEEEAARAYDRQIISLAGADARIQHRLNFPLSDYQAEMPGLGIFAECKPGLGVSALFPAAAAAAAAGVGEGLELPGGVEFFGGGGKQAAGAAAAAAAAGGGWEAEAQGLAGSKRGRVPSLNAEQAAAAAAAGGDASAAAAAGDASAAAAAAGGAQFAGAAFLHQEQQQEVLPGSVEVPSSADVTPFADQGWLDPELMQQLQTDQGWQQQHQAQHVQQQQQQQQHQAQILQAQTTQQQQGQQMPLGSPQLPGAFSPQQQTPQQATAQQHQQQELLMLDTSDTQQQYLTPAGLDGQQAHLQMQQELVPAALEGQQQPQMQMQQELVPGVLSQQQQRQPGLSLPADVSAAAVGGAQGVGAVGAGAAGEAAAQPTGLADTSPLLLAPNAAVQACEGAAGGAQQVGDAQLLHPTDPQLEG